MGKIIKKALRIILWVLLSMLILVIAFFFLIQNSSVQTYLAHKAASYLSRELKTEVYFEKLKVVFPLDIDIVNMGIDDRQGLPILRTERLQLSLSNLSRKAHKIRIGRIALENPEINLVTYEGDSVMNIQFILDYFSGGETDTITSEPWAFRLMNASISNASFSLRDYNFAPEPFGVDYNHLQLTNLYLVLSDLKFMNDTIQARLHHLSANERSGFVLNRMRAEVMLTPEGIFTENLILQTPGSDLILDLAFLFNSYSAFSTFTDSIYLQADILPSELDITDLTYFVPELRGMDNKFTIEGRVRGEVSSLRLRNMAIGFGSFTKFKGDIAMDGLPNFEETFIHVNAKELNTHSRDLANLKLPSDNGPVFLQLPDEVKKLGQLRVKAKFTGFYNDFVSNGTFRTNLGTLSTDIALKYNFDTKAIAYSGRFSTRRFNLGFLLDETETLGFLNMRANVRGHGKLPSTFNATFNASIDSLDFMGNNLNSLEVNGELAGKKFNGKLNLNDELIRLSFLGMFDLDEEPPRFNFYAELDEAYLARLNLVDRDESSRLSTKVDLNFTGNNADNLHGIIEIKETSYHESGEDYHMDNFELNAHPANNGSRMLTLRSDFVDADFEGEFNYSQIYPAFLKMLQQYLPSLREDPAVASTEVPGQSFTSVITLKNTEPLSKLFMPDIVINKSARIDSRFNSAEGIAGVSATAPDITLFGTTVRNWHFSLNARNEVLNLRTGAGHLLIKEGDKEDPLEIGLEKLTVDASFSGDTIQYEITWLDQENPDNNAGDLVGFLTFVNSPLLELRITDSRLMINESPWWFNTDNFIIIDSSSIAINNLWFEGRNQKIMINGKISDDPVERLTVGFENFDLSNLDPVLQTYGVDISGALNGMVDLLDLYNNLTFIADLSVSNFFFNKEKLGDLQLNTSWDPFTQSVWVDSRIKYTGNVGTITPFSLQGFYYPESETGNFDLEAQLFNFKLETMNPFLEGILSNIKGLASGNIYIKGTPAEPEITGKVSLLRTEFRVEFSNTRYSLAEVINIEKDRIWANNVNIFDEYGNSGIANILFTHKNFSDWRMDLRIQANNLAGLHTTASDNSLFYGTAFATGTFSMIGSFNDLTMDIKVRSEPQTYIAIPISFAVDVTETDFIVFVNPAQDTVAAEDAEKEPFSFRMNMDMDITRDAVIQIFLPYQMGNIKSNGTGNIKMHYNTAGDFTMYGDYVTNTGTFLFTLQNMINRTFTLLPGGRIRWSGDPYNADINMQAVYRTRVTLNSLPNISDEYRNRRFPVDCILTLQNSLMNPEISFGIRMPNVDEEIQRQVFSAVDTTNEVVMSRQMISLLVLNSFNFSTDQANLASTLGASSFELLSNQLNSWLSQISKDFDIGINYRPGDQLSSEELELALSTQLFDDRVIIDGNLGMIGEQNAQQNASNIIGDINVEVKITRDGRFRVRAYNKYNNTDITRREAPYTQGVGVFYRREFDRFGDLFIPRRRLLIESEYPNGNNYLNGAGRNNTPTAPAQNTPGG